MTLTITFAITLSALSLVTTASAGGKLEVHDAWAREAPPTTSVMAAYLTLHNHSTQGYTLSSLSSPDFSRVEMHRTEQHEGMSKMIPVSRVMLSTKGSVSFQPGGMHLMLMNPKKRLKAGDNISLTLFFTDESSLNISVPVKKATGSTGHQMNHDNHQSSHDSLHDNQDKHDKHNQESQQHSHSH